PIRTINTV
nr:CBS1 precursor=proteolytic processing site [yeast, Peptide Mitochondrial Partial, 8 aa] [Saccharomyces cerevisiae]